MTNTISSAQKVAAGIVGSVPGGRPRRRSLRGRLIGMALLLKPGFRKSLTDALSTVAPDIAALGVTSAHDLRTILLEAHRRLDGSKNKITATAWAGMAFEVLGAGHPALRTAESIAIKRLLDVVNDQVRNSPRDLALLNGYLEPAGVRAPFTQPQIVHSVWIRRPGQARGAQYVDRALLITNKDGQSLLVSTEFKTRGAAGELRPQIATRDARLLDARHPEGTKLDFTPEGSTTARTLDLEQVILIGPGSTPALRRANLRTKLGVRAGERYKLSVAEDARGETYIRIVLPINTDALRRTLERVLRDKSWQ